MNIQLIAKKIENPNRRGEFLTVITHIKQVDDSGKYVKFVKHSGELLDKLKNTTISLPENLFFNTNPND